MDKNTISRRAFIRRSCAGALAVTGLGHMNSALAEPVKLTEDDPTAMALGYKNDATKVDVEKYPRRAGEEGAKQTCKNCSLYNVAEEADGWGPCTIFPGKTVAGKGWCSAWVEAQ